jgi:hypothetical protein
MIRNSTIPFTAALLSPRGETEMIRNSTIPFTAALLSPMGRD